ncbi:hypothetical protein QJQ45_026495 [Haematococcus lacustris]|nr:hypothetical protein QJQ45_026495 [Haematococcus lacustris]
MVAFTEGLSCDVLFRGRRHERGRAGDLSFTLCTQHPQSEDSTQLGAEQVGSSNSKAGDSEVAPQAIETLSFKRPPPGPLAPEDLHLWATFSVSQLFHTRTYNDREAILLVCPLSRTKPLHDHQALEMSSCPQPAPHPPIFHYRHCGMVVKCHSSYMLCHHASPCMKHSSPVGLWSQEMDVDGNGQLDWVELRGALERVGLPCTPEYYVHKREHSIEQAFRSFDLDGDGTISRTELHRVLASAGIPISHADRHTQEGEGGAISFNEFRRLAAFLPTTSQVPGPRSRVPGPGYWVTGHGSRVTGHGSRVTVFFFFFFFDDDITLHAWVNAHACCPSTMCTSVSTALSRPSGEHTFLLAPATAFRAMHSRQVDASSHQQHCLPPALPKLLADTVSASSTMVSPAGLLLALSVSSTIGSPAGLLLALMLPLPASSAQVF